MIHCEHVETPFCPKSFASKSFVFRPVHAGLKMCRWTEVAKYVFSINNLQFGLNFLYSFSF